jgi:hypothetical protein
MRKSIVTTLAVCVLSTALSAQQPDATQIKTLLDQLTTTVQALKTILAPPIVPSSTGVTVKVAAGGNLQAAIDAAVPGTTILVAPGTFTGNVILRKKATAGVITVRTDGLDDAKLPPKVRVNGPALSSQLAKLKPRDPLSPVITSEPGAHDYALIGLEAFGVASDRDVVVIGDLSYTTAAQLPVNITLDRMYIHGDNGAGHRGVMMNAVNGAVLNSDVRGFVEVGRDSQAIAVINTTGPTLIENNYLEATGENFLTGGADPKIPNALPSDLVVRGNYIFKPLTWKTTAKGSVKNLLELKLCKRCLIENNVLENNWADAQAGAGILLTNRNQDSSAPWSTIQDVTFQYNVVKHVEGPCVNMLGLEDRPGVTDVQGTNLVIRQNLFIGCNNGFQVNNGFQPTTVQHNTFTTIANWFLQFVNNPVPNGQFTYQSNVVRMGEWGIVGDGTGVGVPTLTAAAPGAVFTANIIEKAPYEIPMPSGNTLLADGTLNGRLDPAYRYTGAEPGHDGARPGADIDEIKRRIPWATW